MYPSPRRRAAMHSRWHWSPRAIPCHTHGEDRSVVWESRPEVQSGRKVWPGITSAPKWVIESSTCRVHGSTMRIARRDGQLCDDPVMESRLMCGSSTPSRKQEGARCVAELVDVDGNYLRLVRPHRCRRIRQIRPAIAQVCGKFGPWRVYRALDLS